MTKNTIAQELIAAARLLCDRLAPLKFRAPVSHVYNPLLYARGSYESYLLRYGNSAKRVLFLGMNPGPFGMVQTGVPFGDVVFVRDWLGIEAPVHKPQAENPKRPVEGFACKRREVSGSRLWALLQQRYGSVEALFADALVMNYCPLAFFDRGRNVTPDKLAPEEIAPLYAACDAHLRAITETLAPQWVIGVGAFAEQRAQNALKALAALQGDAGAVGAVGAALRIERILHPSPASPAANRGWAQAAEGQLVAAGVWSSAPGDASDARQ